MNTVTIESNMQAGRWWGSMKRGVSTLLAAAVGGTLLVGFTSAAVAADTCANAAVRAETGSSALPDCRAYEMVSPTYKEGFPIRAGNRGHRFTDDGIISFGSLGSFAGNADPIEFKSYHAVRSADGWMTMVFATLAESDDMRRSLTQIGDAYEDPLGSRFLVGASGDLSHLVFNHGSQGGALTALYEYVGPLDGSGARAREVSINNGGVPTPANSCSDLVSGDGRVIVYTSGCAVGVPQVWARVGGAASVLVSGSECTRGPGDPGGVCNGVSPATYVGAAKDGSRVFVMTDQQLVDGDVDATADLYACDIPDGVPDPVGSANPCGSLTEVSGGASEARVENVVAISDDASRVFFVARGVLAGNLGFDGVDAAPVTTEVPEPHNLYVWERDAAHPAGQVRFVARLATNDLGQTQMTPDGRYLLFLTNNQLVTTGPGADGDGARDAYRYDVVTGQVVRVSTAVAGGGGNDPGGDVSLVSEASAMSADGSMVIFDSAEALSVDDSNGITDVYGWHDDGRVSPISVGGGRSVGISRSGRDIFFSTVAQVLAADGDAITDLYDARVGGGFARPQPVVCSGDDCQGSRSSPPALTGSLAVAPGGGYVEASSVFLLRGVSALQRRVLAASGRVGLVVSSNAAGVVSVRASVSVGGRSVVVGSGRRVMSGPGRVSVVLSLSRRGRGLLASRGRLSVRVAVSHSKVALDRVVTLRLTKPKKTSRGRGSVRRASAVRVVGGGS